MLNKHRELFLALGPLFILVAIFGFLFYRSNFIIGSSNISHEEVLAKQFTANYYEYSDANLAMATENGKAVLFFSTNWCSTCTELDRELLNESEKLEEGITVLKLDYDNSPDLKSKYNVTTQHTLIQVDSQGNEITKWVGGDIETINESVI
jgi:thiol-disulfide isomerase/thioredoxin